jgi:hypothetical protein
VEGAAVEPTAAFAQLQLGFVDQIQWRYEVIRPLVLFADRTAPQRAQETRTHSETVRQLRRRFRQWGMLGLLPADVAVVHRAKTSPIPPAVQQEIDRLKALYPDFHYRELARIVGYKVGYPIDDKTAKKLWHQSPVPSQPHLTLGDYHTHPDRYQARLQVVKLYYQGWEKQSISRWLHVSRPTVNAWIARFEAEHFAGLMDRKRGPKEPPRKIWFPRMVQVYHLQKAQALRYGSLKILTSTVSGLRRLFSPISSIKASKSMRSHMISAPWRQFRTNPAPSIFIYGCDAASMPHPPS